MSYRGRATAAFVEAVRKAREAGGLGFDDARVAFVAKVMNRIDTQVARERRHDMRKHMARVDQFLDRIQAQPEDAERLLAEARAYVKGAIDEA